MDVTFRDDEPFFPNSSIQGGNVEESLNWDPVLIPPTDPEPQPPAIPSPNNERPILPDLHPHVYSQRTPLQLESQQATLQDQPTKSTSPQPDSLENDQGTTSSDSPTAEHIDHDDRPIALRKCVKTYT